MLQKCSFDPKSDIEEVVPSLAVDVSEMLATGAVVATGDNSGFTNVEDIKEVGHYLRDKIQTAIAAYRLGASMSAAAAAVEKPVQPSTGE